MIKEKVLSYLSRERLEAFFMGPIYPLVVAALVLCGYFAAIEYYLHFVNMALITLALCVCRTLRPTVIVLCTFVFQISREHTPATNNVTGVASDYYFTDGRAAMLVISFALVAVALVWFFIRNKIFSKESIKSLPLLLPSALLAISFVLGGAFSSLWSERSLGFSLVQIVVWFIIFYLFLLGFKHERGEEILDYFIYAASVIVIVLLAQLVEVYVSGGENMIDQDGNFIRASISYGWGVTNTAAQSLTVLIPVLFIGAHKSRHPVYYFVMATLAFVASILNLSRTAVIVGVPIYLASLIITFAKSKRKKLYAIEVAVTVAAITALILAFREYTFPAFGNYLIRGLDDSSRFRIWRDGIDAFIDAPIFGKGFFGLNDTVHGFSNTSFIPFMMHNTPVHMLACFGIVGFLAYSYYRISTIIPFVKRPSFAKSMLGLSLLSVLLGSLLENFVFYILPMFAYSVISAIAFKLVAEENDAAKVAPEGAAPVKASKREVAECAFESESAAAEGSDLAEGKRSAECEIGNSLINEPTVSEDEK